VVIGGAGSYTVTDNGGTNNFSYDSLTISDPDATLAMGLAMGIGVSLEITGTGATALDNSGTITLAGGTISDAGGLAGTGAVVGFGNITAAGEFGGTFEASGGTLSINAGQSTGAVLQADSGAAIAITTTEFGGTIEAKGGTISITCDTPVVDSPGEFSPGFCAAISTSHFVHNFCH
jgi:hypothetical protein